MSVKRVKVNPFLDWKDSFIPLSVLRPDKVEVVILDGGPGEKLHDPTKPVKLWVGPKSLAKSKKYTYNTLEVSGGNVVEVSYSTPVGDLEEYNPPLKLSGAPLHGELPLPVDLEKVAQAKEAGFELKAGLWGVEIIKSQPTLQTIDVKLNKIIGLLNNHK